jgi:hypothetical protein
MPIVDSTVCRSARRVLTVPLYRQFRIVAVPESFKAAGRQGGPYVANAHAATMRRLDNQPKFVYE